MHCITENDVSAASVNIVTTPLVSSPGCCVSCKSLQQSKSPFPTSFFQLGNQGLECTQNTKSLAWVSGWMKDSGDLLWRHDDPYPVATWRLLSCGDMENSVLRRHGDFCPVATWRLLSCGGDRETSMLWRHGYLCPVATLRLLSCCDMETSILWRHGYLCPVVTSKSLSCGNLRKSTI